MPSSASWCGEDVIVAEPQQSNALDDEPLECVVTLSGQEPILTAVSRHGLREPVL
ncbi:MAG: hypothetical protein M3R09_03690 [Actinomycetota bacterium]|jgi:hypothetical protein|nr:hypothetical protein [Actinomycetota bacterium]